MLPADDFEVHVAAAELFHQLDGFPADIFNCQDDAPHVSGIPAEHLIGD